MYNKMDNSNSTGKQAADSMGEGSKGNAGLEMETLKPDSVGVLMEPLTMGDSTYKHYRYGYLHCPKFDETNFPGWIMKLEQFFKVEKVSEGNKIRTVMMQLEGRALQWHQYYIKAHGGLVAIPWITYLEDLRKRFSDFEFTDPMADLVS